MARYKLEIAYEGTKYKGWQRLKQTEETIQGKIEGVLSRYCGQEMTIDGAGRTDAGVHARCQVASFDGPLLDELALRTAMNTYLPEDIVIKSVTQVGGRFHARFNATEKTYVYTIWTAAYPPVFERKFVTVVTERIDLDAMKLASRLLIGQHDFKGFSTDKTKKSTTRTIKKIDFEISPEKVKIYYTGDGFLYNMVRILTGTLLEIGMGSMTPEAILEILAKKDRSIAGPTAPPQGLALWHVNYD